MANHWTASRRQTWPRRKRRWYNYRWVRKLALPILVGLAIVLAQNIPTGAFSAFQVAAQDAPSHIRLRIIDGDTYEILSNGERIRQANIDTPETGGRERCAAERQAGQRAKEEARRVINGARDLRVRRTGREDQYGRTIGFVLADGRDVGEILIARGLARPWRGRREPWCGPSGELLR